MRVIVVALLLLLLADFGFSLTNIAGCQLVNSPDYYQFTGNLVDANVTASEVWNIDWACIKVASSDVVIDCNGFDMNFNGMTPNNGSNMTAGIVINASEFQDYTNVTIKNCPNIVGYVYSVYLHKNNYANVSNVTSFNGNVTLLVYNSSHNHISDVIGYGLNNYGFAFNSPSRNNTVNNTMSINASEAGYYFGATQTFLTNASANNGNWAFWLYWGANVSARDVHLFNNSVDFYAYSFSGQDINYTITNMTFDNPFGDMRNYTSLDITDTMVGEAYIINWTNWSSSDPTGYLSFEDKFVDIRNYTATAIDSIAWRWSDSELGGYNENLFGLWRNNGSWTDLGATLDAGANTLSLTNMVPGSIYGIMQFNTTLTDCALIDDSGTYALANDVSGAPIEADEPFGINWTCIKIAAPDVVFDCAGFTIANDGTADATGIIINGSTTFDYLNVTIQNCLGVNSYETGIMIYRSYNATLTNSSAFNNTDTGIYIDRTANATISGNVGYNNTDMGMYVRCDYCEVSNNIAYLNDRLRGFQIRGSFANFINNTAYDNDGDGFFGTYVQDSNFTFNRAWNNSDYGVYLNDCNRNNASGNEIFNSTNNGMHWYYGQYNNISNNTFYNNFASGFYFEGMDADNNFFENVAYNNSDHGFFIDSSENIYLLNNSAFDNTLSGFYSESSQYDELEDNLAFNNGECGFDWYSTDDDNFTMNKAYGNGAYGIVLNRSTNVNVSHIHLFNNTLGALYARATAATEDILLINVTVDNPFGTMVNYTSLDITDTINVNTAFLVKWASLPAALPATARSLAQKWVNITNAEGVTSIDTIVWNWLNSESAGFDETLFEIWKHDGSTYTDAGATLNTGANTLTLNNFNPASDFGIVENNISECEIISSPGDYRLNNNLTGAPISAAPQGGTACIKITSSNVLFDCNGYNITNNGTGGTTRAIIALSGLTNVSVRNCPRLADYSYGLEYYNTDNGFIDNVSAFNNVYGFHIWTNSDNNTITRSVASGSSTHGFWIRTNAILNNLTNNTAEYSGSNGIYVSSSGNTTLKDNIAYGNNHGIDLLSSRGCNFTNNTVYNNSYGLYLWTGAYSLSFYNIISGNIAYNNSWTGIFIYTNRNNISNNLAYENGRYGYELGLSFHNMDNNIAYGNGIDGFYLNFADENNLTNNSAYSNLQYGMHMRSAEDNLLYDTTLYNNSADLYVENTLGTTYGLSMSRTLFLNPAGTLVNYTNMSMNDTVDATAEYSISWTSQPAAFLTDYWSFRGKFADITDVAGGLSLDTVTWHWLDSELTGYNESVFGLWEYNASGWALLNDTPDTAGNSLMALGLNPASQYGILQLNDTNAPQIALNGPADGLLTNATSINFNFTAIDDHATAMNCSLLLNGTYNTSVLAPNNTLTNILASVGEGSWNWSINCRDAANNSNTSVGRNLTVDLTPPTLVLGAPENITYNVTNVIPINLTVSADAVACWYDAGAGQVAIPGCLNMTVVLANGFYNMSVGASDTAGNTNFANATFTVDVPAPPTTSLRRRL
ncbi:MAG: right-handed parallel beta-helix repeat-containing protein [Candidatus Micrarchaeota archaeon]